MLSPHVWTSQAEGGHLEMLLAPCFPGRGYYTRKNDFVGRGTPVASLIPHYNLTMYSCSLFSPPWPGF